ncbi:MAG TPA: methyl-accepting chemotaxis protein [Pusillimonas sp.]|mgnify:CR=1 FL=1|jgi:methyl-accepting chemotaxis protein|nr:methyl-accepting chemotaxis protein [Pusillimonas sp.]MBC41634.1 methyl-accepting chemotaxis protein [Pusillimonas sp.]HBT31793.1 methyl-accepting chemotaxis protein [Pusillimonas sp.]HCP78927.1 methyl-accepting chemotaxis protein [Pusillimonas sp.]|tara:strand:+ start:114325 stop:115914 length:1590 start_codon:yes stop_codon:yes gene_type:complete
MKRRVRLGLGTKMIMAFLLVAAMSALTGAFGVQLLGQVNAMAVKMFNQEVAGVRHASQAQAHMMAAGRAAANALLVADKGTRISEIYFMRDHLDGAQAELEKLKPLFDNEEGRLAVEEVVLSTNRYAEALENYARRLETEGMQVSADPQYLQALADAQAIGEQAEMGAVALVLQKQNTSSALANETTQIYQLALSQMGALSLAGALLAILLGAFLARGLKRQLGAEPRDVVQVTHAVAKGDLSHTLKLRRVYKGSVLFAMNQMQTALRHVVGDVHRSSDEVALGARHIAEGSTNLAQRTEQQAQSLLETVATMDALAQTVDRNAGVARDVAQKATLARERAENGGEAVETLVNVMHRIDASSRRVTEIVALIDELAFQTNILALNAAVEAARAGQQGKGFAVVAGEVRSLAQRSATAARDIRDLVRESTTATESGSQVAGQTRSMISEVVEEVRQVSAMIHEISDATDAQKTGIQQVNSAVSNLSSVTQENALLVRDVAARADDLSGQAAALLGVMSVFKLGSKTVLQG